MTDQSHHHPAHQHPSHDHPAHDHRAHDHSADDHGAHDHSAGRTVQAEPGVNSREGNPLPPSFAGSVVLDVGGLVGALVLYAAEQLAGAEVEVVRLGEPGHTTHSAVRQRQLAPGRQAFAAVYPGLPAGEYRVDGCQQPVTVNGGRVTEASLDAG
jgi:hypothetical protein